MTDQQKIIALAKLDGWESLTPTVMVRRFAGQITREAHIESEILTSFLTSYDAIIPLIQKQDLRTRAEIVLHLRRNGANEIIRATPSQLCDALLKAKGLPK